MAASRQKTKQQSACEACGSRKQKDKTKQQSTCVACRGRKQTKQKKHQPVWLVAAASKKKETTINMSGLLQLQAKKHQPVWPVAAASKKKQSTCESGGGSPKAGENNLPASGQKIIYQCLWLQAEKNKTTLHLCGLSPPQVRQNHHKQDKTTVACRERKNNQPVWPVAAARGKTTNL